MQQQYSTQIPIEAFRREQMITGCIGIASAWLSIGMIARASDSDALTSAVTTNRLIKAQHLLVVSN